MGSLKHVCEGTHQAVHTPTHTHSGLSGRGSSMSSRALLGANPSVKLLVGREWVESRQNSNIYLSPFELGEHGAKPAKVAEWPTLTPLTRSTLLTHRAL